MVKIQTVDEWRIVQESLGVLFKKKRESFSVRETIGYKIWFERKIQYTLKNWKFYKKPETKFYQRILRQQGFKHYTSKHLKQTPKKISSKLKKNQVPSVKNIQIYKQKKN